MSHAMVTFAAPLALAKLAAAQTAIDGLGNPANAAVEAALALAPGGDSGTHFASLHAIPSRDGTNAHIVFEFSADGTEDEATKRIIAAIGGMLKPIFALSSAWTLGGDIETFLKSRKVPLTNGLLGNPGLAFAGTPGFTVGRIHFEDRLARACATLVEGQHNDMSALARVADVRAKIAVDADLKIALQPATAAPPFKPLSLPELIGVGLADFASIYLWPVIAVVLVIALIAGLAAAWPSPHVLAWCISFTLATIRMLWAAAWVALAVVIGGALVIYFSLRKAEASDSIEMHTPPKAINTAMFDRENRTAQNHMISITRRKPGWIRWFTARLVFWVIGVASSKYYQPGFLSNIGTIHFARWVTIPGTRDLLFLSNYGGSWESYLEDFITKAHAGLTGIWSNTMGFPRTENLFQRGATDGDRFKRFARHSMVPTRFWYSAYPETTTLTIRSNALIRAGLSGVMTEDEAIHWLALFGSAARPASKLVSSDIQSLIFGGLGFLPFGTCLICELPTNPTKAKSWLKTIRDDIAFNDGRRLAHDAVITLALSWRGLTRVGLPDYARVTFPFAFVEGMTADYRLRILGDSGDNSPNHWRWGKGPSDAAVLIYGRSQADVATLKAKFLLQCASAGMPAPHEVPFQPVTNDKTEPFGFVDGISQPVIRGTYKSLRNADPINVVEPGEMILGYPDNRGYVPPSPTLEPNSDPGNKLPLLDVPNDFSRAVADATRDLGFNGSFLVIRELEQDVDGFAAFCKQEATRLKQRVAAPYSMTPEFIGAKLVGRWKDGSSMVRHPYESATEQRGKLVSKAVRQRPDLVVESIDVESHGRPRSNPADGMAIDSAAKRPDKATVPAPGAAAATLQPFQKPIRPDNDFLFGAEDADAMRCPFGAHIRRANPRDSLDPGNAEQIAISNRHRITRIGRHYVPKADQKPGLFFMCFCADIERQFEFLQQTWLKSPSFHGLTCEKDPLLGDGATGTCGFTVPSPDGPIGLNPMPRFVTTKGGGYFFLPGRRLIDYLIDPL